MDEDALEMLGTLPDDRAMVRLQCLRFLGHTHTRISWWIGYVGRLGPTFVHVKC